MSATLRVWGRANSINVQKVLWALTEVGMPYERIDAGMAFGKNNTPEFKRMNPNGKVPVIEHGDFVLWESNAIVRYVARLEGKQGATRAGALLPRSPQAAATADQWMEYFSTTVWLNLRPVFWGMVRTPPAERDLAAIDAARRALGENLAVVDRALARQPYLAGDAFSMGDIPMALTAFRWFNMAIERPAMPNLERWYSQIVARAAFQKHCMSPLT
eukprot:a509190_12.p1 GENE.a509190_12~~a509190_12.p1  ORF type:complete len:232 (-),score=68.65 a509190_12:145-792(-)